MSKRHLEDDMLQDNDMLQMSKTSVIIIRLCQKDIWSMSLTSGACHYPGACHPPDVFLIRDVEKSPRVHAPDVKRYMNQMH